MQPAELCRKIEVELATNGVSSGLTVDFDEEKSTSEFALILIKWEKGSRRDTGFGSVFQMQVSWERLDNDDVDFASLAVTLADVRDKIRRALDDWDNEVVAFYSVTVHKKEDGSTEIQHYSCPIEAGNMVTMLLRESGRYGDITCRRLAMTRAQYHEQLDNEAQQWGA